jgi:hypothetical protein
MRLAVTPTQGALKAAKRFKRLQSRFKKYTGSALNEAAVAFKMHWVEGIATKKYDSRFMATWFHTPVYHEWKKTQTGTPQFGLLSGKLIKSIQKYKINDFAFGVRLNHSATGVRHWAGNESYSVRDYAYYLEYGRKNKKSSYSQSYQNRAKRKGWRTSPGAWAQKPRPIFYQTKLSYIWYWNKFLKRKFGKNWPAYVAQGLK